MPMAATTNTNAVRVEIHDNIAVLRMIRGDNRWNLTMANDFEKALDEVER